MEILRVIGRSFLIALVSVSLFSCANNHNAKSNIPFRYVEVPVMMSGKSASDFVAKNFWKNYTSNVDSASLEEASVTFFKVLLSADKNITLQAVNNAFAKGDSVAVRGDKRLILKLISSAEHLFYYPNSPYLNEEVYLLFLNNILKSEGLSDTDKLSYEYQHKICSLNRVATVAQDFEYKSLLNQGKYKISNMHSIKGDYTLIFFNNPDCHSCADILDALKESSILRLCKQGKLSVLAMYIDEQLEIWNRNSSKYPREWIYAYDHNFILRDNEIYGLRAIPSLYLLDKEKRVILKDAPVEAVIAYLNAI